MHFFLVIILQNPAIWLVDSILAHNSRSRILPHMGWWWNINNNIRFHFRLFPRKLMPKFLKKPKKPILSHSGHDLPTFELKWILLDKGLCLFLNIPVIYHHVKNQKKIISYSWEKRWTDGQTDKQTDRQKDRQTDRQTDRQSEAWTDGQTMVRLWTTRHRQAMVIL